MEKWEAIWDYPGYMVSDHGRVRNDFYDGRVKTLSTNQRGIVYVGLSLNGKHVNRSVSLLVANAFLDPPQYPTFDTPINLDGDRYNNYAANLLWRPRWFAYKYMQQFNRGIVGCLVPIINVKTGESFTDSWEAALKYGLLDIEVTKSITNEEPVFPTGQIFGKL